jgi:hypothetical protein
MGQSPEGHLLASSYNQASPQKTGQFPDSDDDLLSKEPMVLDLSNLSKRKDF